MFALPDSQTQSDIRRAASEDNSETTKTEGIDIDADVIALTLCHCARSLPAI